MSIRKIIVVGSMNMDMVVKTSHIPKPGETVLGGDFFMNPGGKGANQAVAIARLGGDVAFIAKIGQDIFGKQSAQLFDDEGVDTRGLLDDDVEPSGIALITVDEFGENSIVVAPGANAHLKPNDVSAILEEYPESDILLMQLEIPMETVKATACYCHANNIRVIVNPAPANLALLEVFPYIDVLTPNVHEAELLSGVKIVDISSARKAAEVLKNKGIQHVIITLGEEGAVVLSEDGFWHVETLKVAAVDTTAAGDVFNGALAVALSEGKGLREATKFACQAAALAVTRLGAQASIPYRKELLLDNLI
ncbi:ribokinase [Sphingobacterium sp. LRF_L2]|uniref:ribokinase n=1 Tax=Sphingobacterium sp. LRF_L2 TaxID=3369421 RepID=UPI003F613E76